VSLGRLLRWTAVAIAVAAAIDPAMSVNRRVRPKVALITDSREHDEHLWRGSFRDFDFVAGLDPSASAAVAVALRYPEQPIPESLPVATVSIDPPDPRLVSVSAPASVPAGTMIHVDVDLASTAPAGRSTSLTASIGGAVLARADHKWNGPARWRASLDVAPIGEPPYSIDIHIDGAAFPVANAVVDLGDRLPVLFYDARPSWTTTFVRHALENDPRFAVSSAGAVSRGVVVRTTEAPQHLQRADLDRFRAVVVGGLDALSASDAAELTQFMVERGGSVAVLPDERVESAAARSLVQASPGREVLLEKPASLDVAPELPRLEASELLPLAPPADAHVLARTTDAAKTPIIWTTARGEGRLLVSGAMDAWRFRSSSGLEFDRFWQSAIAGLALAVRPPLSIDVIPPDRRGQESRAHVGLRAADPETSVTATLASGEAVRLWPDPQRGSFSGVLSPSHPGPNRVDVVSTHGGRTERASARFVGGAHVYAVDEPTVPLNLLSATHGGVDVTPANMSALDAWLRRTVPAKTEPAKTHPMRSLWWMVPFAGCLCGEWWIRRKRGLQ
jgi:hypothetical protein